MNLAQLVEVVLSELDTPVDDPKFWSREDVITAINEGYEEITDATEWYQVTVPLPLTARRTYFDLRTLGHYMLTVFHVFNRASTRWANWTSTLELDGRYREWMFLNGEPEWIFRRGLTWLGIFPYSSADSGQLQLQGSAMCRRLVRDTDEPGFPEEFQRGLIEYALFELKAQDHEFATAEEHYVAYLDYEKGLETHVISRTNLDKVNILGSH